MKALVCLMATCALLSACSHGSNPTSPTQNAAIVAGKVTAQVGGVPLSGATVTVTGGPANGFATTTTSGSYELDLTGISTTATIELTCSCDGFASLKKTVTVTTVAFASADAALAGAPPVLASNETAVPMTLLSPQSAGFVVKVPIVPSGTHGTIKLTMDFSNPSASTAYYLYFNDQAASACAALPENLPVPDYACHDSFPLLTYGAIKSNDLSFAGAAVAVWVVFKNWGAIPYVIYGKMTYVPS